jgi:hypothetical protein
MKKYFLSLEVGIQRFLPGYQDGITKTEGRQAKKEQFN